MGVTTFKGGVHPYDGKDLAKDQAIVELKPQGLMVYPLSQHIGAPAKPLVAKGDTVLVGQKIAEAGGFISSPVICSVSGTVKAIEKRLTAGGAMVDAIVVENDQAYNAIEGFGQERDYTKLSRDEIVNIVKEAGIVGLGGAGFPTSVKLMPKDPDKIDYFLVNGAECEPYLTSDYRDMMETPEKIIGGLKVVLSIFPKAKGVICIEDNKPEAIKLLTEKAQGESNIEVVSLKTKYPQGGERQLIFAVTGRKINSSMLPADAGCIVDNADTMVSIYEAVCESKPLVRKIVTVTGDAVAKPGNFKVPLGMSYQEIVDQAGGFSKDPEKIICGGPMMGIPLFKLEVPVAKNSSSILALAHDQVSNEPTTACISCGRCVEACPENLIPTMLMKASLNKDTAKYASLDGMECIECGCCTYVCPAKRPLTQGFKQMKRLVNAERRAQAEKAKAEAAKETKSTEEVKK
ncbi:electron transport complex subunit RsxC [Oribacterium sp. WCC10]|uniref:electron transport complex subunit RsxC n=1 Tax=Oribacterium sp. WCC10 TaxID=1855343 RepID=UPI0008F3E766|nr:electron transport complex subunit RsxC [Oribacterium sp. WCC10]SFG47834.1 electron transport complex protein RnfC [Oribacterium sp. WCC10]